MEHTYGFTFATRANMERAERIHGGDGRVFAWSPTTGERFSACPGDYWNLMADQCLTDHDGERMFLVVAKTIMLDAIEGFSACDAEDGA